MSKKKSNRKKHPAAGAPQPLVNTLGIDIEPTEERPAELPEEAIFLQEARDQSADSADRGYILAERAIGYATLALSVVLLGGSVVFWFIIGRHLVRSPSSLVDADYMRAILICCAVLPVFVAGAQTLLRRAVSIERWLICMCVSGSFAALFVVIYQLAIRGTDFALADLPVLICCTVSGCTLPAAVCTGARWLLPVIARSIAHTRRISSGSWDEISRSVDSVSSFEDFDF